MELTTVPTFTFPQGDPFLGEDTDVEYPVRVEYYQNCISLEQDGKSINITYAHAKDLFKEIQKHLPRVKAIHKIKD